MRWRVALLSMAVLPCHGCDLVLNALVPPAVVLNNLHAPKVAKKGQPVTVTLSASFPDGCTEYSEAGASVNEVDRTVRFWGRTNAEQTSKQACTAMMTCRSKDVTFIPTSTGTYTLRATLNPTVSGDCQGSWTHLEPSISEDEVRVIPDRVYDVTLKVEVTE